MLIQTTIMRSQAIDHPNVRWLNARAEETPLPDNSVDGIRNKLR